MKVNVEGICKDRGTAGPPKEKIEGRKEVKKIGKALQLEGGQTEATVKHSAVRRHLSLR